MKLIETKNGKLGQGNVSICVPICEADIHGLQRACSMLEKGIDVVEWRMDYFQGKEIADWVKALKEMRNRTQGMILLATWRSMQEGGVQEASLPMYEEVNRAVIQSGMIDLIDIELFKGEQTVKALVEEAHLRDVKVILSNHDHHATPSKEAMMIRLKAMQRMGADIVKLAVMPQNEQDVYDLLSVSSEYAAQADSCAMITMAMGSMGVISRICGEMSGSVMSFATLNKASAPGQLPWKSLRTLLDLFHDGYRRDEGKH